MTDEKIRRLHGIYSIVTAALCILAGISLILACLSIYAGGEGVFSRESVWAAFLAILAPLLLFILALIGGAVLSFVLPLPSVKGAPSARVFFDRARVAHEWLLDCADLTRLGEKETAAIAKEGRLRRILTAGGTLAASVCAIPPLVYFLDFSNFPNKDLTAEVMGALYVLLPCSALALYFLYIMSHLLALSYDRENALLRSAVKAGAVRESERAANEKQTDGRLRAWLARHEKALILALRGGVLALSAAFIILGVDNGGMNDVLQKAIRICTECIGLG